MERRSLPLGAARGPDRTSPCASPCHQCFGAVQHHLPVGPASPHDDRTASPTSMTTITSQAFRPPCSTTSTSYGPLTFDVEHESRAYRAPTAPPVRGHWVMTGERSPQRGPGDRIACPVRGDPLQRKFRRYSGNPLIGGSSPWKCSSGRRSLTTAHLRLRGGCQPGTHQSALRRC